MALLTTPPPMHIDDRGVARCYAARECSINLGLTRHASCRIEPDRSSGRNRGIAYDDPGSADQCSPGFDYRGNGCSARDKQLSATIEYRAERRTTRIHDTDSTWDNQLSTGDSPVIDSNCAARKYCTADNRSSGRCLDTPQRLR